MEDLADRIHLPVGYLAVVLRVLGGVTRYNEHPFTDGAHCPSKNVHNNLNYKMVVNTSVIFVPATVLRIYVVKKGSVKLSASDALSGLLIVIKEKKKKI